MSCDAAFITTNTYSETDFTKNYLLTRLSAVRDAANPTTLTCTGITKGNDGNNYNSFYLLSWALEGLLAKNSNLINNCVAQNTPVLDQFGAIQTIQNGATNPNSLANLQKEEKEARLRLELLRSSHSTVTNHQVFLLGRPLRPASIPLLWALSVLFIGIAALIFYTFSPFEIIPSNYILFQIYLFLINPYFIASALLIAVISVIVATLHITGTI